MNQCHCFFLEKFFLEKLINYLNSILLNLRVVSNDLNFVVCADLQRMFFDALCDQDVIMQEAFCKWESAVNST